MASLPYDFPDYFRGTFGTESAISRATKINYSFARFIKILETTFSSTLYQLALLKNLLFLTWESDILEKV